MGMLMPFQKGFGNQAILQAKTIHIQNQLNQKVNAFRSQRKRANSETNTNVGKNEEIKFKSV